MRKIINCLYIFLLFIISICLVSAKSNPYPKTEPGLFGGEMINCTWYAWQQAKERMGVELPLWYYVETWYSKAEKAGYSVGKEPKKDSIMVWDYGEGWGGHVAYVTDVEGNTVFYTEGGSPMNESGINDNYLTMNEMGSFLVGFIYLDKVPTPPKETTNNSTTKKEETKPVEQPKSNNSYLKELKVSVGDIAFNKDTLKYNLEVPYDTTEVTITSSAEDEKAIITGNNTYALQEGANKITISVKAENEEVKEYIINIIREAKAEEETIELEKAPIPKVEEQKLNKKEITIIAISGIFILIIFITIIIRCITKQNKKAKTKKTS